MVVMVSTVVIPGGKFLYIIIERVGGNNVAFLFN